MEDKMFQGSQRGSKYFSIIVISGGLGQEELKMGVQFSYDMLVGNCF